MYTFHAFNSFWRAGLISQHPDGIPLAFLVVLAFVYLKISMAQIYLFIYLFISLFIYSHVHTLGHFSLLPPPPSSLPFPPPFQAEGSVLHFSPVLLKSRNKQ
jgi:hypothetical protein